MKNTITLNSRYEMPLLGFGTYKLTDPKADEAAIVTAIHSGYRLLDTAQAYILRHSTRRSIFNHQDLVHPLFRR